MNPLDIILAGLFEMLGYNNNTSPDAPKLDGSEKFDVKGQTEMQNKKGKLRDFRNPKVSANRPPTLSPVQGNRGGLRLPAGVDAPQVSPGQLNLYGQTAGSNALPPAGQSGGSMPPGRASLPVDGRPKPQQGPQTRRQAAQSRLNTAAEGARGTKTITPKAGAAEAAEVRLTRLKDTVKSGGKNLQKYGGTLGQILNAILSFQSAKEKGATNVEATRTTAGALAGGAAGARAGLMVPGGPYIKGGSALLLSILGAMLGEGAIENLQGYNQSNAKPDAKPDAKPQATNKAPEQSFQGDGPILDTPELRKQLGLEMQNVTPIQKPLTNPNQAPIRAQLKPLNNIGVQQVTPRDALRPELYAQ